MRAIADFTGESPSRVTLRAFRHYWFRVKVETVTKDNQQRERHPRDQYSAVEDLVTVVGKISEVPTASSRDLTS
jgi:hypothetical protein